MTNEESMPILTKDKNLLSFWEDMKPDTLASAKSGKAEFATVLMMRVRVPGSSKGDQEYEVDVVYPEEFPHPIHGKIKKNDLVYKQYGPYIEEYKKNQGSPQALNGTPIEQWALVNKAQAHTLKHLGIHTVEALASLKDNDNAIGAIGMGGRKLVNDAAAWLVSASNNNAAMQAEERARKSDERFAELESRFNELAEAFEALPEDAKAKVKDHISKKHQKPNKKAA